MGPVILTVVRPTLFAQNVCDLSRFAPSQLDQSLGQAIGLPLTYACTGFVGLWAAGATQAAFGEAMWQVPEYFSRWRGPFALLGGLVLAVAILAVNVLANLLSPMNDILNVAPHRFSLRACGYACLCIAVLVCPWWLFSSQRTFVLTFLGGYASVTGAIAGVLLTDFWVLRGGVLEIQTLYRPSQCWEHHLAPGARACSSAAAPTLLEAIGADFNWRAIFAVVAACGPCMPGFVATLRGADAQAGPVSTAIYSMSWFVSLSLAAVFYWALSRSVPRVMGDQRLLATQSQAVFPSAGRSNTRVEAVDEAAVEF